jgi:hypothetical protein
VIIAAVARLPDKWQIIFFIAGFWYSLRIFRGVDVRKFHQQQQLRNLGPSSSKQQQQIDIGSAAHAWARGACGDLLCAARCGSFIEKIRKKH